MFCKAPDGLLQRWYHTKAQMLFLIDIFSILLYLDLKSKDALAQFLIRIQGQNKNISQTEFLFQEPREVSASKLTETAGGTQLLWL